MAGRGDTTPRIKPRTRRGGGNNSFLNASGATSFGGSLSLSTSFNGSLQRPISTPRRPRKGVVINENFNRILEISTLSTRIDRGDGDLFYPEDYEPDPLIECYVCKEEAESDDEKGKYRIYNIPDGGWELLCPRCDPPDSDWEFDRTVFEPDTLFPPEIVQHILLFLPWSIVSQCCFVCRQWNDVSWARLMVRDDEYFARKLAHPKLRHCLEMHVYLENPEGSRSHMAKLCEALPNVQYLLELHITGSTSCTAITQMAEVLREQQWLQELDVGACEFYRHATKTLIAALEDMAGDIEVVFPICCVRQDARDSVVPADAAEALVQQWTKGTNVEAVVV